MGQDLICPEEALQEEDDVLEEAKEEQDLYDELDLVTQQAIDPMTEKDTREHIKLNLVRYKQMMNKKTTLINKIVTQLEDLEHEVKLGNEVNEKQKNDLEEKESKKVQLKSQIKKAEKELDSSKTQFKVDLGLLRDTLKVVTKKNNELQEALENKEAMVAALTEELTGESTESVNNDNNEHNVSAVIHNEDNTQRVSMNKESSAHKCQGCDKDFSASGDLERHVQDKHTESKNCFPAM